VISISGYNIFEDTFPRYLELACHGTSKKRNRCSGRRIFKRDRKSSYRNRGISIAKGGPLAATDFEVLKEWLYHLSGFYSWIIAQL